MNLSYNIKMEIKNIAVMTDKELLSRVITFLRFPLIIGVVLLHMHMLNYNGIEITNCNYPFYYYATDILTEKISRLAVPLFFIFSGFLFFCKLDNFTKADYFAKIRKRIRTLLVPYLFWNTLLLVFMIFRRFFMPRAIEENAMSDWSLLDWLNCYWGAVGGMPISLQFWFIRDLLLIMILSPIVYKLLKLSHYTIFLLGILWLLFDTCISSTGFSSFFFFSLGAYFGIYKKNFVTLVYPYWPLSAFLYVTFIMLTFVCNQYSWDIYVTRLNILIGICFVLGFIAFLIKERTLYMDKMLTDSNFFIFAYHIIALNIFDLLILKRLCSFLPICEYSLWGVYLFKLFVVICVGVLLYNLIHKTSPKVASFVTGGRS